MSDRATVKRQSLDFGTTGTSTVVPTATGTNTSNPIALPRDDYTVQVTVTATGTSIVGGQVVWQASNDGAAWFPLATAIATAICAAGAGTSTAQGAGVALTSKYAYGRGIVSGTGTGNVSAFMGS